jgi:SIR2-like domain
MQADLNIQTIADLMKKEECCIFIGAGIPKSIKLPLWAELAKELVDILWMKGDRNRFKHSDKTVLLEMIEKDELIGVISYCQQELKLEEYESTIYKMFYDEEKYINAKSDPVYVELTKVFEIIKKRGALIVQTNIDKSLEYCCSIPTTLNIELPNTVSGFDLPRLVYLHGIVTEPQTWILTQEQYNNFYLKNNNFTSFIETVFQNFNVLFLGYSMKDKEILDRIAKVKGSGRNYIVVLTETDIDKHRNGIVESLWDKTYNISVFRYSIEDEGYDAFPLFLKELNSAINPIVNAQPNQVGSTLDG